LECWCKTGHHHPPLAFSCQIEMALVWSPYRKPVEYRKYWWGSCSPSNLNRREGKTQQ
jgi:hypothetical protein